MSNINKDAADEVIQVLENSEYEIVMKIPQKLLDTLKANANIKDSDKKIDFNDEHWIEKISPEARAMLAVIYRDFIATKEERERLLKQEQERRIKEELRKNEQFNSDNMFSSDGDSF